MKYFLLFFSFPLLFFASLSFGVNNLSNGDNPVNATGENFSEKNLTEAGVAMATAGAVPDFHKAIDIIQFPHKLIFFFGFDKIFDMASVRGGPVDAKFLPPEKNSTFSPRLS